ncbi:hypothetical protein COOONC_01709 [Cooperia oncophora]
MEPDGSGSATLAKKQSPSNISTLMNSTHSVLKSSQSGEPSSDHIGKSTSCTMTGLLFKIRNPDERTVFEEYILKYGDYRETVASSVPQLERLDLLLNDIDQEYVKRNLRIPSESSDDTSHEDIETGPTRRSELPPHHANPPGLLHSPTPLIPHTSRTAPSRIPADSSLLNFCSTTEISTSSCTTTSVEENGEEVSALHLDVPHFNGLQRLLHTEATQ